MTRYAVITHYRGAQHPTVLVFDAEAEADAFADRQLSTYTDIAWIVTHPIPEEEDDNLAGPVAFSAALHIVGAVVASGLFFVELGRLL